MRQVAPLTALLPVHSALSILGHLLCYTFQMLRAWISADALSLFGGTKEGGGGVGGGPDRHVSLYRLASACLLARYRMTAMKCKQPVTLHEIMTTV